MINPCPFCGCTEAIVEGMCNQGSKFGWRMMCNSCDYDTSVYGELFSDLEDVLRFWNSDNKKIKSEFYMTGDGKTAKFEVIWEKGNLYAQAVIANKS